ncbi:MAG: polysaccharide pyruvyl transferase family protein, partial [Chloroflexales bacterium]|nr:polysaccharide pyruvyl transferase family protein [Chloroflexales bacterium]
AIALHDARQRFGDSVAILSRDPAYTRWLFPDVPVIPYLLRPPPIVIQQVRALYLRFQRSERSIGVPGLFIPNARLRDQMRSPRDEPPEWITAIRRARQLYLVGGGYLTDLFDVAYHLLPIEVANASGVAVATAPLGIGPFHSPWAAKAVAQALRNATVTVRDTSSLHFCRDYDLRAELCQDDGFRAAQALPELELTTQLPRPDPDRMRVGVCVFKQHGGKATQIDNWWKTLLGQLQQHADMIDLEGFPFHESRARGFSMMVNLFEATNWGAARVRPPTLDFRALIQNLRRYDLIISTRFHAIVVAHVLGTPHIAAASGNYYATKMHAAVNHRDPLSQLVNIAYEPPERVAAHVATMCCARRSSTANTLHIH